MDDSIWKARRSPPTRSSAAIRKATIDNEMVPVVCGTSYQQQGRAEAAGCHRGLYARSYWISPPSSGINPETDEEEERPSDDKAPFSALAFKIMTDPYVGRLCFFRVYSGTVEDRHLLCYNSTKGKQRAYRPHPSDARQPPRGYRAGLLRRYRCRRRPEEHHHRRHPVRRERTPSSWSPWSSRSRSSAWPSSPRPRPVRRRWPLP